MKLHVFYVLALSCTYDMCGAVDSGKSFLIILMDLLCLRVGQMPRSGNFCADRDKKTD